MESARGQEQRAAHRAGPHWWDTDRSPAGPGSAGGGASGSRTALLLRTVFIHWGRDSPSPDVPEQKVSPTARWSCCQMRGIKYSNLFRSKQ